MKPFLFTPALRAGLSGCARTKRSGPVRNNHKPHPWQSLLSISRLARLITKYPLFPVVAIVMTSLMTSLMAGDHESRECQALFQHFWKLFLPAGCLLISCPLLFLAWSYLSYPAALRFSSNRASCQTIATYWWFFQEISRKYIEEGISLGVGT